MSVLRRSIVGFLGLILLLGFAGPVLAQDKLDAYRAQGVVAERFDGFVEVRGSGAPADAGKLVAEVNAKRRAIYEARAKETGTTVQQVGAIYAQQVFEKAPAGTPFRKPDGSYVTK